MFGMLGSSGLTAKAAYPEVVKAIFLDKMPMVPSTMPKYLTEYVFPE